MNKSILWLIGLLFVTSLSIVSCSETDGTEDPYASVISGILTPLLQWRKPIEAMEKGNGKSSVPINFHLWD